MNSDISEDLRKVLCENVDMLNNQVMFAAETYYNVLHYIIHNIINKNFTEDEIELLKNTVRISKINNEDIANTFFRHADIYK
jgi:hypothetical protein